MTVKTSISFKATALLILFSGLLLPQNISRAQEFNRHDFHFMEDQVIVVNAQNRYEMPPDNGNKTTYSYGNAAFFDGKQNVPINEFSEPEIVKTDILLEELPDELSGESKAFLMGTYKLHAGIKFKIEEGKLVFYDHKEVVLQILDKPFSYDRKGKLIDCVYQVVQKPLNEIDIYIVVPVDWLKNADYPVMVDPTTSYIPDSTNNQSFGTGYAGATDSQTPDAQGIGTSGGTEIDAAFDMEYSDIRIDDANEGYVNKDVVGSALARSWLRMDFVLSETETSISKLAFTFKGWGTCKTGIADSARRTKFYVWNYNSGAWDNLGDDINATSSDTHSSTVTDTSAIQNYIDGTGNLHFLAYMYRANVCSAAVAQYFRVWAQYAALDVS
ncbi:MAG: hypothetical protein HQL27_08180, partial [Candidatus Omnitrophica bacterium]|nr:hypothetical protein [Candidatus Omnitrophota bacterium]